MNFENTTRRSFLKKTTVIVVGASSLGLFTGLVDAADAYATTYCLELSNQLTVDGVKGDYVCTYQKHGTGSCGSNPLTKVCGTDSSGASVTVTCGGASKKCKNLDPNFK